MPKKERFPFFKQLAENKGKTIRSATGKKEPFTRPDEKDETRLKYKAMKTDKDPLFGYKESKKMVDEANEAQARMDARKKELEEMKKKKKSPSMVDKFKEFFKKKEINIDPKELIKGTKGKK